jgi:hypothetical protein
VLSFRLALKNNDVVSADIDKIYLVVELQSLLHLLPEMMDADSSVCLQKKETSVVYPNVCIVLRTVLTTSVTAASADFVS